MMQMLGSLGGGWGKAKNDEDETREAVVGGREGGPKESKSAPKAIRLVYCNEKGKFQMDAGAVAALQLVKGPLGVVSVCGRARQGKSFILNQLLGRSSGFQVGPTHRPCTKGLWMWSVPIKRTAADGMEYNLLLLDSEGIDAYDQTGTYSTQIFSLAVLLSSMFIYNQMGGIDEAALDKLSLVTEMTKHIRVRASQKQTSAEELGQFSPIFMWLLRDFYLDLTEDGRTITAKEYLESALQPMLGNGKAVLAKNEIRSSIRSLFPDRHCFTLVRPLNDERELQRLDQIPMEKMRPEFRSGLDHLTKFVFERTRPKQLGSIVMTGPLLAALTQSFLDAINAGAVPTIATSWQNVEENECRRAYHMALSSYTTSLQDRVTVDQGAIQEIHETAFHKAMNIYSEEAVGVGAVRAKYEKSLQIDLREKYEEYKRKVFMEADFKCIKAIERITEQLRAVARSPSCSFDQILQVLNAHISEYERSTVGPTKWQKLAKFLQQSIEGPLHDLLKRECNQAISKHAALELKCQSMEDKISLISRQGDAAERDAKEWKRRYEIARTDLKSASEQSASQNAALQSKISKIEEKCISLQEQLQAAMKEAADWRSKYDHIASDSRAEKERQGAELVSLQSKYSAAEARLAAAKEQSAAAKEEAAEWRRKYDTAITESRLALEKATLISDRAVKQAQQREDTVRAELSLVVKQKETELRQIQEKLEERDRIISSSKSHLKEQEAMLALKGEEIMTLQAKATHFQKQLAELKNAMQTKQRELDSTHQEKGFIQEQLKMSMKTLEETKERCQVLEHDVKKASDEAEKAFRAVTIFEREKLEAMRLAVERLALLEAAERRCEGVKRDKEEQLQELERVRQKEREAVNLAVSSEKRLEEGENKLAELLDSAQKQNANSVGVLEDLLATERAGRLEANARADALSIQLQSAQNKLDKLQDELIAHRLNETSTEMKFKVYQAESSSRKKRSATEDCVYRGNVEDMDFNIEEPQSLRKKPRFYLNNENGDSPHTPRENNFKQDGQHAKDLKDSQEYMKLTIPKLKQELVNAGFGEELFLLRNPNKKDILSLYEKCILHKKPCSVD